MLKITEQAANDLSRDVGLSCFRWQKSRGRVRGFIFFSYKHYVCRFHTSAGPLSDRVNIDEHCCPYHDNYFWWSSVECRVRAQIFSSCWSRQKTSKIGIHKTGLELFWVVLSSLTLAIYHRRSCVLLKAEMFELNKICTVGLHLLFKESYPSRDSQVFWKTCQTLDAAYSIGAEYLLKTVLPVIFRLFVTIICL